MEILVTGSAGFVGSHVLQAIEQRDGWEYGQFDAGDDFANLPDADVVISLAATADPKEALRDPVGAYINDIEVMVATLDYARECGARVLHVSTNEVYGPGSTLPYRPQGPYAGAKACQEIVCHTYPDVDVTIVVTQSLFGERQQPDKLVPTVIRSLLEGDSVKLQRGLYGWVARPFMHVANLADALLYLVDHPSGKRVHVGATESVSVEWMATTLAALLDCELKLEATLAGLRPGHESRVRPIGNDIPGWRPTVTLEEGLAATANWYLPARS